MVEQRKRITEVKFAFPNEIDGVIRNVLSSPLTPYRKAEDIIFIRKFFIEELDTKAQAGLGPGQLLHSISTVDVDRIGDVMMPRGADLRDYKKNPIVLWSHDYRDPDNIIGKNLWIKPDEKGIAALTEMDIDSEKAAKIFRLYQKGLLKGWSIGFIPIKMSRPKTPAEAEAKPGTIVIDLNGPKPGEPRLIHEKWILLEYSAVAVPMNPYVTTDRVAKEFGLTDAEVKEFGFQIEQVIDKKAISDRVIMDLAGGKEGEEEEESGGEAQAQAAAAEGGKETCPTCGGADVRYKVIGEVKIADLDGNPSPNDIREAIQLALNPGITYDNVQFRWVAEVYPVKYPDGHAICSNRKNECFQFDYTFKDGEAVLGEKFEAVEMTWKKEPEGIKSWLSVEVAPEVLKFEYVNGQPVVADYAMKPYPNEHACRLVDPGKFAGGTFRTTERKHEGKTYRVIMGKLKGKSTMTEQAYRYPKDDWKAADARAHCKSHDGILFEPASGKEAKLLIHEEVAHLREAMEELSKRFDEKAGRVLSEKNRTLVQAAVDKLKASGAAMEEATSALEDLLTATEGKSVTEEEQIVLELGGPVPAEDKDVDVVMVLEGEEVTAKEVAEEFDVKDLVDLIEKKTA